MITIILMAVCLVVGFGLGILYKGRKFRIMYEIAKDSSLTYEEKARRIGEIVLNSLT